MSASKSTLSHYNLKILSLKVTKNLTNLLNKLCEFRPWWIQSTLMVGNKIKILAKTWTPKFLLLWIFSFSFVQKSIKAPRHCHIYDNLSNHRIIYMITDPRNLLGKYFYDCITTIIEQRRNCRVIHYPRKYLQKKWWMSILFVMLSQEIGFCISIKLVKIRQP